MGADRTTVAVPAGKIDYVERGSGPPVVFVAGIWANADLWRETIDMLASRYRCIALDLPLGAHRRPLPKTSDRSPQALARLILDVLVALDLHDVTLVGNDTAGGLVLIALNEDHPGLARVGRLVLTTCDSYEHFPPKAFLPLCRMARRAPKLTRRVLRSMLRRGFARRRFVASVAFHPLGDERMSSFFDPMNVVAIADDVVRAMQKFEPTASVAAGAAIERFDKPVLLAWADSCQFFPVEHGQRLAKAFPNARLEVLAHTKTFVPIDAPERLGVLIGEFAATP